MTAGLCDRFQNGLTKAVTSNQRPGLYLPVLWSQPIPPIFQEPCAPGTIVPALLLCLGVGRCPCPDFIVIAVTNALLKNHKGEERLISAYNPK